MTKTSPSCPKCQSVMREGFLADGIHGGWSVTKWVAGMPKKSFWTGISVSGKKMIQVSTYRCVKCGYLESYAKSTF